MPRFAANLSFLFTELEFLDRFKAAAQAGFKGVEYLFPYHHPAEKLGDILAMNNLTQALFNAPPGDWAAGERGLAALPGRQAEFRDSLEIVSDYAEFLECNRVHIMAGIVPEEDWDEALDVYVDNLIYATKWFRDDGIIVTIEPINTNDMPGYFLSRPDDAVQVLEMVGARNLKLQYDVYHAQIMQGGIADFLEGHMSQIAHVQIAGVPGRHEPDRQGELNWQYIFDLLDAHGYGGWVGCEYKPRINTLAGLKWGQAWGLSGLG